MASFATLGELAARLDWTLDTDEERIAVAALEDASNLARHHAGRSWPEATSAPALVRTLVLKACMRYMVNPSGYTQSRAGDESLSWSDAAGEDAGTVYFTRDEKSMLAAIGGKQPSLASAPISAWHSVSRPVAAGLVPVSQPTPDSAHIPLFADEVEPW